MNNLSLEPKKFLLYVVLGSIICVSFTYVINVYLYSKIPVPDVVIEQVSKPTSVAVSGLVSSVSTEDMAADGPGRITITNENGEVYQIAVPGMNMGQCAARSAIADVTRISIGDRVSVQGDRLEQSEIVPCADVQHYLRVEARVLDLENKIQFAYRKGPLGYLLEADTKSLSSDSTYRRGYSLTEETRIAERAGAATVTEGPPIIMLRIYSNKDSLSARAWSDAKTTESNVDLAFEEPTETEVAGIPALMYTADGLYPIKTYVVSYGGLIYLFTGAYSGDASLTKTDIEDVVGSAMFIP